MHDGGSKDSAALHSQLTFSSPTIFAVVFREKFSPETSPMRAKRFTMAYEYLPVSTITIRGCLLGNYTLINSFSDAG